MQARALQRVSGAAHKSYGWKAAVAVLALASGAAASVLPVAAKTPGTVHCYGKLCHRIHDVEETDAMVGRRGVLKASYYDDCKRDRFNPCGLTSSGAVFRPDLPDNAASPIFPDGTVLLTYNPETKLAAVVRVNSAGPYRADRTLDVSRATAEHLGFQKKGVATLEVAVLKSPENHEARYKKLRSYDAVPGFLGKFETFDDAQDAALAEMALLAAAEMSAVPAGMEAARADIERLWPRGLAMEAREPRVDVIAPRMPADALDGAPTLADAGPSLAIAAREAQVAVSRAGEVLDRASLGAQSSDPGPAERATLTDWLLEFLENARERARLRRGAEPSPLQVHGLS